MQFRYDFSQTVLPEGSGGTIDLLLRFQPPSSGDNKPRRALNLSVVLDRSGSMSGGPLKQAIKAAESLLDQLTEEDTLSVVTYDDTVDTVIAPQKVKDKAGLHTALRRIGVGGTTNLSGGWLKGCEHIAANLNRDHVQRVLLLTDGQANVGVTDPAVLIKTAGQKAEAGVVTTTLGFGARFNEDLLIGMAKAAGGNFYFIQSPDEAADVFGIELSSLKSVAAQNLTVTLKTADGVTITNVLSSYRTEQHDGGLIVNLGDVYENEDKLLALEISLPPSAVGTQAVLNAQWTCDTIAGDVIEQASGTSEVAATVGTADEAMAAAPGTDVIAQISRIRIARAKDEAVELADKGETAAGAQRLRDVIADLRRKGLDETFEFAEELDQLAHFAERIESKKLDDTGRKELRDQSYQGRNRGRTDLLARGTSAGSAAGLPTLKPDEADAKGVTVRCEREGGKLRVHVLSSGYDPRFNVQFPRSIREEGVTYVVEELRLSSDRGFYHTGGTIWRVLLPGQENRYAGAGQRSAPRSNGKAASVTGSAADLDTTDSVGDGVLVQCVKEGSKLRARVVSDGFDPNYNMRFPRDIREENTLYVVDEVIETANGGQYVACGKIRRLIQAN